MVHRSTEERRQELADIRSRRLVRIDEWIRGRDAQRKAVARQRARRAQTHRPN